MLGFSVKYEGICNFNKIDFCVFSRKYVFVEIWDLIKLFNWRKINWNGLLLYCLVMIEGKKRIVGIFDWKY